MNNIDLINILSGHEGEFFYSPVFGYCEFIEIHFRSGGRPMIKIRVKDGNCRNLTPTGRLDYSLENIGECILWPSKEDRDWISWNRINNKKKPIRIWSELFLNSSKPLDIKILISRYGIEHGNSYIEKSTLAFIQIYQLIEEVYGGYPTSTYSKYNTIYQLTIDNFDNIEIIGSTKGKSQIEPIRFKSYDHAVEFLKYNKELVISLYHGT